MQSKAEAAAGLTPQDSSGEAEAKVEADGRSVYVGNVDYAVTPEELQLHFQVACTSLCPSSQSWWYPLCCKRLSCSDSSLHQLHIQCGPSGWVASTCFWGHEESGVVCWLQCQDLLHQPVSQADRPSWYKLSST